MRVLGAPILLISVLIPFIASIISMILGKRARPKPLAMMAASSLIVPLLITTYLILQPGLAEGFVDPPYFTHPTIGTFTMLVDSLSAPVVLSIALVTAFVAWYSVPYMTHRLEEMEREGERPPSWGTYYSMYLMFSAAMMGTVLSTNLVEFYLFLELTLIPSFLLIAFYGYGARVRIAIMYLLWTHVGALFFLVGIFAVGLTAGTFDILDASKLVFNYGLERLLPEPLRFPVALAIMIGLFVKLAIFGVHIWLPYAHAEAPTPVSALLSPNLIGIAGYALIRIAVTLFPQTAYQVSPYLMVLALITMIYGGLMALAQDDFKRLLAYSSVSQMGYILLGIASMNALGFSGAILHYVSHAVGKALLFMTAGVLIVNLHGLRSISKMGGLAARMPLTASLALIGFMHITGVPPSLGLWSEILTVLGAVNRAMEIGSTAYIALLSALIVAIGLSTAYAFITMKRVFFGELSEHVKGASIKEVVSLLGPMAVIASVGIGLFFYPGVLIDPLMSLVKSLYFT